MWAVGHMFHSSTDSKLHNIADAIDHLSDITSSIDNLKNEVVKLRLELNNLKKGE
jgi:frataxin-like iron-binding protein CyaY